MKRALFLFFSIVAVLMLATSCFSLLPTAEAETEAEEEVVDVSTTYFETYDKFADTYLYGMRTSTGKYSKQLFQLEVEKTAQGTTWYLWVNPVISTTESVFKEETSYLGTRTVEEKYELIATKTVALPAVIVDDVAGRFTVLGIEKKTVFGENYNYPLMEQSSDMHGTTGYASVSDVQYNRPKKSFTAYKTEVSEQFVRDFIAYMLSSKHAVVEFTDQYGTLSTNLLYDVEMSNIESLSYFNNIMIEKGLL